ncbi:MAG: SRPBCC family protein [Gaiellales bacterium]
MSTTAALAPIEKSLAVACAPERAFQVFTREIGTWWPTNTHALNPGAVAEVVWEEREGGSVYEIAESGERARWATVLAWEPPHRLVISWEVNPERTGTEVEVTFTPEGDGTRVELVHRGFENVTDGATMREGYNPGWDLVLGGLTAKLG